MKCRKGLIFICLIIFLFSIAWVSAGDVNETVVTNEDQRDNVINIENQNENDFSVETINEIIDDEDEILSTADGEENLSYDVDEDVLGASPPYNKYSVSVSDTTLYYGKSGNIKISITPASSSYSYRYDFYLKVYDSGGNEKISKRYYSTSSSTQVSHNVGSTSLSLGKYTIKILNYVDNQVMDTASLTVKSVPYSAYSVSVSSTTLNYDNGGSIVMSISPASSSYYYRYDFYLKVYDSGGKEKISKRYYSTSSSTKATYSVGSTSLPRGSYTIKILNNVDNHVMATASLNVKTVTIESNDVSGRCDQVIEYKVRVLENGEYKSGLSISFTCNGKKYTVPTNSEGYATLNIHLKSGTYKITTNYLGSIKNNNIVVNKVYVDNKYRNVVINSPNAYFKENKMITYGWEGNLKGSFNIYKGNSLIYSTNLDTSGYITDYFEYNKYSYSYPINNIPSTGLYTVKLISSNGDVLAKSTFRITKADTKTIGKSFTTLCGFKNTVRADLYDKQGNNFDVGGKAKFKIGKKVYNAKVKHGSAKVKVNFPSKKKTYNCKVEFLGDNNFKGSSAKFKIKATKIKNPIKVGRYSIRLPSKQYKSISKAVSKGKHKSKIVKTKYSKKFKKPYLKTIKHYKTTRSCYTIMADYYYTMNRMRANGWTKVSEYKYNKKNPRNKYGIGLSAYTYAVTRWVKVSYKTAYKAKYYPVKAKIITKGTPMKNPKIKLFSHGKTLRNGKVAFA